VTERNLQLDRLAAALADRYAIVRELGAGGMATVYLAEDLRHRRKVAIKVLRPELAASLGPERFLREIEVAAQLTHPHILPLHDSGAVEGFLFYVMPYIDGESLRTRLDRVGELPITEAVRILREIADALSHAHAMGVVHRDIKPDNVMLSGRHALVVDFGVAKAVSEATGKNSLTTAGVALGTPTYMAPEQAAADPHLDHRVDIYALGAMGYELLAGRPPFTGRTPQEVLGMHVTQAPDPVDRYRPGTPPALVDIIMRCLAKRPSDRWQSADELVERLEPLATPSGGITPTTTRPISAVRPLRRRRTWLVVGIAALLVLGAFGIGALADRGPEPLVLGRRTQVTIAPELELDPALSPDGKLIAYASGAATTTRIYVRQVEGGTPVEVAPDGEEPQRAPQWSPDGSTLLFTTLQSIYRVPALGGIPQLIASSGRQGPSQMVDAVWSPDGGSIAYVLRDSLILRELASGAERSIAGGLGLFLPAWSPDGRWIAVTQGAVGFVYGGRFLGDLAPARIILVPAAGGEPIEIAGGGSLNIDPTWRTSRELLFVSNREGARDIYRQPIGSDGRPDGPPLRLTTGLNVHTVSLAADGSSLAYATFVETVNVWSLPSEPGAGVGLRQVTTEQQIIEGFDISSDGKWLAFDSNRDGSQRIFRMPLAGGPVQRLTEGTWDDFLPRFSPDDRRIAYHSYRLGERKLFSVSSDGGAVTQLTTWPGQHLQVDWAPDGKGFVYEHRLNRISSIRVAYERGSAWADSLTLGEVSGNPAAGNARFSPDGRFVSFSDNGTIRVVPVAGGPERMAFARSDAFATLATWAPAGHSLYVFALDSSGSSLWEAPLAGSARRVAVFDDPNRQPTRYGLVVRPDAIYITIGARQADISLVTLDRAE
jgi:Tol biopolymer transport system component